MSAAVVLDARVPTISAPRRPTPALSNAVLATTLFVFTEVMLFTALIAAFVVLRSQYTMWPPMGQPRLPIEATAVNTAVLLGSGVVAASIPSAPDRRAITGRIGATFVLGAAFVAAQGVEWWRLLSYGLEANGNVYGGLFYTIVGAHAAHVLGALVVLAVAFVQAARGAWDAGPRDGLVALRLYWLFVVAVWPVLYALVYLW